MKTKIDELEQHNAEYAVEGALYGYNKLIGMNGETLTNTYNESELFTGNTKTTINTAGTLGNLVSNFIGITLNTTYHDKTSAKSTITNPAEATKESEELLKTYLNGLDNMQEQATEFFKQERTQKQQLIKNFNDGMNVLKESYKTGNLQEVADAIEKVSDIAIWSTEVPVGKIYGAMKEMKHMTDNIYQFGVVQNALDVSEELSGFMQLSSKIQYKTLLGLTVSFDRVAPRVDEIYSGRIDSEKIAMDLMRINN